MILNKIRVLKKRFNGQNKIMPLIWFILFFFFCSVLYTSAFTEPSQDPPRGDVTALINSSNIEQVKQGQLGIAISSLDTEYGLTVGPEGIKTTDFYVQGFLKDLDTSVSITDLVTWDYVDNYKFSIPPGTIIMWSGNYNLIPAGWALADGQDGRPDLRNKFVYGANTLSDIGYQHDGFHSHVLKAWLDRYCWTGQSEVVPKTEGWAGAKQCSRSGYIYLPSGTHFVFHNGTENNWVCAHRPSAFSSRNSRYQVDSNQGYGVTSYRALGMEYRAGIKTAVGGYAIPPYFKVAFLIKVGEDYGVTCIKGSDCYRGNYCEETTQTCKDLITCAVANSNGYGYLPQQDTTDYWGDCTTSGCGTGLCIGGDYQCGYETGGQAHCGSFQSCNSAGHCVSESYEYGECGTCQEPTCTGCKDITTGWGGGAAYGCAGDSKRCDGGTCITCDGFVYTDGCGGCAGQGGSACWYLADLNEDCNAACEDHGGCISSNWNDSDNCDVCKHFLPSASSCTAWGGAVNAQWTPTTYTSGISDPECYKRQKSDTQACNSAWYLYRRLCVCKE